jgi:polyisoprenyl-teichoic acid--peptidoglycan teichoic acid transferase
VHVALLVVALIAAGVAGYVASEVAILLSPSQALAAAAPLLSPAVPGRPTVALVIGIDRRTGQTVAHADALILVRVDPASHALAITEVPRTQGVSLPGRGPSLIDRTFAVGGPRMTVDAVERVTGLHLNYVAVLDLRGFRSLVDSVGGIYVDVDRPYFFDGSPGEFGPIHVPAGYQRLSGLRALALVRDRHEDDDYVRLSRQLLVLRSLWGQVEPIVGGVTALARHLPTALSIVRSLARYVDVVGPAGALSVREAVSWARTIGAIPPDHVSTIPVPTGDPVSLRRAIAVFLRGPVPDRRTGRATRPDGLSEGFEAPGRAGAVVEAFADAEGRSRLRVLAPTLLPRGSTLESIRLYRIAMPGATDRAPALRATFRTADGLEHWGVQETAWLDPPLLRDPSRSRLADGRRYRIYLDGGRVHVVAFRDRDAVYWVSNSLFDRLSEAQMLAVARSLVPAAQP